MTMAPADIGLDGFSGRVGETFPVEADGRNVDLILEAAEALPGSPRAAGGFRLEFLGPTDPMLGQGVFEFAVGDDRWEIFIVPIARDAAGTRYESVFY